MTTEDGTTVTPWAPLGDLIEAMTDAGELDVDLVILPSRIERDGRGVYRDVHLLTTKELRGLGVRAGYLHDDPDKRTFQSQHAHDVYAALALWALSSASWDGLKGLAQYIVAWGGHVTGGLPGRHVSVSVARLERPDGAVLEGLEVTGLPSDVSVRVMAEIRRMLDEPSEGNG